MYSFIDVMDQTTKLQRAARAEFGVGADKYFSDVTGAELAAKIKSIDAADVRIDGDSATVTMAANEAAKQASSTVKLKKVGANWKIDAASLFGLGSPAAATEPAAAMAATAPAATQKTATDRRVEIAHSITETTQQMVIDIKARKFASASDAYQEYWNRTRGLPSTACCRRSLRPRYPPTQRRAVLPTRFFRNAEEKHASYCDGNPGSVIPYSRRFFGDRRGFFFEPFNALREFCERRGIRAETCRTIIRGRGGGCCGAALSDS